MSLQRARAAAGQVLVLACLLLSSDARAALWIPTKTLVSAAAVRKLPVASAADGLPVRISGVITYVDTSQGSLFVQDASAGIYVFLRHAMVAGDLYPGKRVIVEGVTTPGDYCPSVMAGKIVVAGDARMPEPKRESIDVVLTGALDSQWAELSGVVRSVRVFRNHLVLTANHLGRGFTLTIPDYPPQWEHSLLGSEIAAKGAISTRFNDRRQLIGVNLNVPSPSFLAITRPASDAFNEPTVAPDNVGQFPAGVEIHRVRVDGTITAVESNGSFYLSDGRSGLAIHPAPGACHVHAGDAIDVVGFPASQEFRPTLEDAICRKQAVNRPLKAEVLNAQDAFRNNELEPALATKNDMKLVSLKAKLVQTLYGARSETLLLDSGGSVFTAVLPTNSTGFIANLQPGSLLRLTGVCLMSYDALEQGESFRLLLRSPFDVFVLSSPPWWNSRHALWLLALLMLMAVAALFWIYMLRKRVREQTALIRVRLEKEAALETRYRNLFQSNLVSVLSFNSSGEILDCNPAFARLLGASSPADLIRQRLTPAVMPHDAYQQWIQEVSMQRNSSQAELCLTDRNMQPVWVYASVSSMIVDGEPPSYQATFVNISVQRKFEQALIEEKNLAEAASRLKGEFLANMSHEIRTPMNAVLGMTSLALSVDVSEEVREYLRMAQDAANQLLSLLNDVLDYSKMEAGKLVLERIEFSPQEVVRRIARMLAVKADEKRLELLFAFAEHVPLKLCGDSYRLQQLLVNLVGNAIKFTEKGEVCVSVSGNSEGAEYRLRFSIRDTGIGIEPCRLKGVFEPFTQADGSTTRKHGGTGLGLSICQQLISLMGGTISVESSPGEGSTFTFDCLFERAANEIQEAAPVSSSLRDKRLLILTSNVTASSILESLTPRWGMMPVAASTVKAAEEAMASAMARREPFDLILAERDFAGCDGFEFVETIREAAARPVPAIMMLSSIFIGSDLGRCRRASFTGYVLKPVDADELRSGITQLLEQLPEGPPELIPGAYMSQASSAPLKILLAEDNATNRKLASVLLRKAGHEVVTVENGLDAVAQCETQQFDAILMDVQMPVMDGFEATACIRNSQLRQVSEIPIIALTAHALPGYRERCLDAGMTGYLTKPIDPQKLKELLHSLAPAALSAQ